jgi:1,4-alpha-glucan branching enzyme
MTPTASASASTIAAIVAGHHDDPFGVLGLHEENGTFCLRAFVPGADEIEATSREGAPLARLARLDVAGFFEGELPARTGYLLRARNAGAAWLIDDPYAYGPVLARDPP